MIHARDCDLPAAEDSHCRRRHTHNLKAFVKTAQTVKSQEKSLSRFHWGWASLVAQWQRSGLQFRSRSRGGFDSRVRQIPLEKGLATRCRILAWRIPMDGAAGGLQSLGSRFGHD